MTTNNMFRDVLAVKSQTRSWRQADTFAVLVAASRGIGRLRCVLPPACACKKKTEPVLGAVPVGRLRCCVLTLACVRVLALSSLVPLYLVARASAFITAQHSARDVQSLRIAPTVLYSDFDEGEALTNGSVSKCNAAVWRVAMYFVIALILCVFTVCCGLCVVIVLVALSMMLSPLLMLKQKA
jgi:hypothetical protein